MSMGVQSKYPVSAGARGLMGARFRYDIAVKDNQKNTLTNAVDQFEHNLKYIPETNEDHINMLMSTICERFRVEPRQIYEAFVKKYNCNPRQYAVNYKKSREGQPVKV